jgi:hypothetical protein
MDHDAKQHGMHSATDNPGVLHESSDADTHAVIMFGVWLAVLTVACALSIFPLIKGFEKVISMTNQDPAPNPMMPAEMRDLPPVKAAANFPSPRLQPDTPGDIARFRAWEQERLENYQVIDEAQGTVRIPVSRAMELTLQRGLPTRGAAAAAAPASPAPVTAAPAKKPAR